MDRNAGYQFDLAAHVVCRQLGFPHGNVLESVDAQAGERYSLNDVLCTGKEERLVECNLGEGFLDDPVELDETSAECRAGMRVACRQFPVSEALENVTIPGSGTAPKPMHVPLVWHSSKSAVTSKVS